MDLSLDYVSNLLTIEGCPRDVAQVGELLARGSDGPGEPIGFTLVVDPDTWDYDGYIEAWGCGGKPLATSFVSESPGSRSMAFDTAGGPPDAFAKALSRLYPGLTVTLDTVWPLEPGVACMSGTWRAGEGAMAVVPPAREHWSRVRPQDEDWELDEIFARPTVPFVSGPRAISPSHEALVRMARDMVAVSGAALSVARNEADELWDRETEAALFLKLDGNRLGCDLEIYEFEARAQGDWEPVLRDLAQEIVLPLRVDHASAYAIGVEALVAMGRAIYSADKQAEWEAVFDEAVAPAPR